MKTYPDCAGSELSTTAAEPPLAHVAPGPAGGWREHLLHEHLVKVARLAGEFAQAIGSGDWAAQAGQWHDLGKYRPSFQKYIRAASGYDAHIETAPGKVKHAIAGAIHAVETLGPMGVPLAYLIAGHHAGLPDWLADGNGAGLSQELTDEKPAYRESLAGGAPAGILATRCKLPAAPAMRKDDLHFWLRILFSCLVDADFLDTEGFMDAAKGAQRAGYPGIPALRAACEHYMTARFGTDATHPVQQLRAEIRRACIQGAKHRPGLFSLSVPTGGGKTLASLSFALHHAELHGLQRVIYVIPYTSIIEQTSDVFRDVFKDLPVSPVVEHHCNLDLENETPQSRLAAENWDAPIIVTTNVQFFESLYAAKPSRCRKLHNIARSVVILDEAQLLPPEHLAPIVEALRHLMESLGSTVVLSTATQPALHKTRYGPLRKLRLRGLGEPRELAPDPERLQRELDRVRIEFPASDLDRRNWPDLAAGLADQRQVLAIVNRRNDAAELWRQLPQGSVHLSAAMCGAHRAQRIAEIRAMLQAGEPVRVASTQLVEAGVDFDFPVVYRAMAGLDSIAQAAGRCNREGRLAGKGRVVVFHPPKRSPSGLLLMGEQAAASVLAATPASVLTQAHFESYFDQFYAAVARHDAHDVLDLLTRDAGMCKFQFRTAAARFRLIPDEGQRQVLVTWGEGAELIEMLKRDGPNRDLMRRLQRHTVTLRERQWKRLLGAGDLVLHEDFLLQQSPTLYDEDLGLLIDVPDYDPANLAM